MEVSERVDGRLPGAPLPVEGGGRACGMFSQTDRRYGDTPYI